MIKKILVSALVIFSLNTFAQTTTPFDKGVFELNIGSKVMKQEFRKTNLKTTFVELGGLYNVNRTIAVGFNYSSSMCSDDVSFPIVVSDGDVVTRGYEAYVQISPFFYQINRFRIRPIMSLGYLQSTFEQNNIGTDIKAKDSTMTLALGLQVLASDCITFTLGYKNDNLGRVSNDGVHSFDNKGIFAKVGILLN